MVRIIVRKIDELINLNEWDSKVLAGMELPDNDAQDIAKTLTEKRIMEIIEFKGGLSIKSNSHVGRVKLGSFQINVNPKIKGMPLYKLLRYAYGLRDLKLFNVADHTIDDFSFFDLLIYELCVEAEDLVGRGIQKSYIKREENLSTPRGRIDLNRLCNQGGLTKDTLPCEYYNRDNNNIINQILLAGLKLGIKLALDNSLKIRLQRLCSYLEESICDISLTRSSLQLARNSINRLTGRYAAVLEIINILYESQGIQFEDSTNNLKLRGYFFDMNAFFETLIGRLIRNCSGEYSIKEQLSLHDMFSYTPGFNPCGRKAPTPRPDFALVKQAKATKLLDAKYRDLWNKDLPSYMLYQLAIYALSGVGDKTATILYPSMDEIPSLQKIDINDSIFGSKMASVILQPVNLIKIAEIIDDEIELSRYVDEILHLS